MRIDWGRKWNQKLDLTLWMCHQGRLSLIIQAPSCNRHKTIQQDIIAKNEHFLFKVGMLLLLCCSATCQCVMLHFGSHGCGVIVSHVTVGINLRCMYEYSHTGFGLSQVIQKAGLVGQPQRKLATVLLLPKKITLSRRLLKLTYFTRTHHGGGLESPLITQNRPDLRAAFS